MNTPNPRARVLFVDDQERARQLFLRAVDTAKFEAVAAAVEVIFGTS